ELYEAVAAKFPDTPQGKEAADRAKDIRDNKQKILAFYDELSKSIANARQLKSETPKPEPPKLDIPKLSDPTQPIKPIDAPKNDSAKPPPPSAEPPLKVVDPPKKETPAPKNDAAKPEPAPSPKTK